MPATQPYSNTADPARGSSLHSLRVNSRAKEEEEKTRLRRKKGVIVLVEQFLFEQGYQRSLEALQTESGVSFARHSAADNMDLVSMCMEFEEYFEVRFGRKPRLYRVNDGADPMDGVAPTAGGEATRRRTSSEAKPRPPSDKTSARSSPPPLPDDVAVSGTALKLRKATEAAASDDDDIYFIGRGLKPLPRYASAELNELAAVIQRDILDQNPSVTFDDIAELQVAKQLLREAVVMPVRYPALFDGIVRPWKGILLYGPPGTGKTMLAKAVATECRTTFFNISASTVVSKWRGDSEKLVRMLFELAAHYAPSTVFIDEVDSIMSTRSSDEHEGSRRMKTEFLVQLDGVIKSKKDVFVLAASNVPWDIDGAILRRLEKRILVGLPTIAARGQVIADRLKPLDRDFNIDLVASRTEGFSGADLDVMCREATMRTVRLLIARLEQSGSKMPTVQLERPKVTTDDVLEAIRCTRCASQGLPMERYKAWDAAHGSSLSAAPPHLAEDSQT